MTPSLHPQKWKLDLKLKSFLNTFNPKIQLFPPKNEGEIILKKIYNPV